MRMLAVLLLLFSISLAQLKVVATYPWIGELVKEVGKDRVSLYVIAKGTEDPHFVVPKPSHIAKMRDADLLIVQGASLEVGFLPPLLQQSNNPKIQPGRQGYLDLSQFVELIEKPVNISRAMGDVHPEGNPHYQLDPHNIPPLARAIAERLCQLDSPNCAHYRGNLEDFLRRWNARLTEWDREFAKLKGIKVIQYHKLYDYLLQKIRNGVGGNFGAPSGHSSHWEAHRRSYLPSPRSKVYPSGCISRKKNCPICSPKAKRQGGYFAPRCGCGARSQRPFLSV
jgi:zinc/manganese transport system substrate-binding protein